MDTDGGWVWVQGYTGTSGSIYEIFGFAASPPSDYRRKSPPVQWCDSSTPSSTSHGIAVQDPHLMYGPSVTT